MGSLKQIETLNWLNSMGITCGGPDWQIRVDYVGVTGPVSSPGPALLRIVDSHVSRQTNPAS